MVMIAILFLLIGVNLISVITEKTTVFYKDIRFWLIFFFLVVLVLLTLRSYPL